MPQYFAPGVYTEEEPSGPRAITRVGTSTAGFIGVVDTSGSMPVAPLGRPQLIDSWGGFTAAFGDLQQGNRVLAHAVRGFFDNGGEVCWVIGVSTIDAAADSDMTEIRAALAAFEALDDIALVAVPGAVDDLVRSAVLDHCATLQDRFAILDGRPTTSLEGAAIRGGIRDSSYGAIYHPWIDVGEVENGATVFLPPSGHVAGVFARVDAERGVHQAPANEVIRGARGVQIPVSRQQQALLNPVGINVIRTSGGDVTIHGARTLAGQKDAAWRSATTRRLFLFLRESIDDGTRWVESEPNGPDLWARIRRDVGAFLTTVWADGALQGDTPDQAFFVRCDESTTNADMRDLGQVVMEIGVALMKPGELVVFRISQSPEQG